MTKSENLSSLFQKPNSTKLGSVWELKFNNSRSQEAKEDWKASFHTLCRVGSAEAFWRLFAVLKSPSNLPQFSNLAFFRENVSPMWEDEFNKNGGKWTFALQRHLGAIDKFFHALVLIMASGESKYNECFSGIYFCRRNKNRLEVWVNTRDETVISEINEEFMNIFRKHSSALGLGEKELADLTMEFTWHEEDLRRETARTRRKSLKQF